MASPTPASKFESALVDLENMRFSLLFKRAIEPEDCKSCWWIMNPGRRIRSSAGKLLKELETKNL